MTKEEAVSIIEERIHVTEYVESSYVDCVDIEALRIAIKALEQPERKKGEWMPEFNGKFKGGAYWFSCSKCKRIVPEVRNGGWNYCPNCGADMRGGEDE